MSHRKHKPRTKGAKGTGKRAAILAAAPPGTRPSREALTRAPILLARLAAALNACDRAGIGVRLAHGAVLTDAGYVLRIEEWQVRSLMLTEFPAAEGDDLDS